MVATFNRREGLERLLRQLALQSLDPSRFEVIVVDDGSRAPVSDWLPGLELPFRVTGLRQQNAGAPAARHRGILAAQGDVLVITDDDMQLEKGFLEAHLACHADATRRVVVGRIQSSTSLAAMPVFERFHARLLDRWGSRKLQGDAVYTGNLSLRRADYLAVGGFDASLERAEDIDLGFRLEQAGVQVVYAPDAVSVHDSDHADFAVWRRRAVSYGRCWTRMGRKYPEHLRADPWHAFFSHSAAKRPFALVSAAAPRLGLLLGNATQRSATLADRAGLDGVALGLVSLLWAIEFFRGVRAETGGLAATMSACRSFVAKRSRLAERDAAAQA